MTEKAIQNIYNKLLSWEGKSASKPYPIHKRLDAKIFGFSDIYEWIANTYKLNSNSRVLDAGCGVGFGSLYLSKQFNCNVTGISLSNAEVEKATIFASKNINVSFKQQSYDDLKPNSYDFIMAIESVKHTLDINKTIASLQNALKPNGTLLIVDDFLITKNNSALIKKYTKDWALKVILEYHQFSQDFMIKKDLTPYVKTKSRFKLAFGIFVFTLLKPILKIATIMRGGFYLEALFKRNMMTYYAIEFKKQ